MGDAGSERRGSLSLSTDTSFSESVGCGFASATAPTPFGLVAARLPTMRILRKSPVAGPMLVPAPPRAHGIRRVGAISFGLRHAGL